MTTYTATPKTINHQWFVIDAKGKTLGRLATECARYLRGKHKPEFTPHMDTGDYVIVINAKEIQVSGNKKEDKIYHHHTGYPGGIKSISLRDLLEKSPQDVIIKAVKGMMPRGPLSRQMQKKLKVYAGAEHDHMAQKPQALEIRG